MFSQFLLKTARKEVQVEKDKILKAFKNEIREKMGIEKQ
jgi:hypothetical protein